METSEKIFIFLSLAALTIVCVYLSMSASVNSECLRLGWTKGEITWNFEQYCVKRIDQTDKVSPLSELKK